MTRKQRRLTLIGGSLAVLGVAAALVLFALKDSIVFFNSPTDVVSVRYQGIVPDLFREGQGVVAEGKLEAGGLLAADTVLAKHDERYMPREVVDALKKSGRWQEGEMNADAHVVGKKP
jgi:cytochrome c-type biogenesis protein CcmE